MSAQSINQKYRDIVLDDLDSFLVCEGNAFRNIVDYDLKMKVDYEKLRYVLYLKDIFKRSNCSEDVAKIINKIIR